MRTFNWYASLIKPPFAPPANVFGIAWSILYPLIILGFAYGTYLVLKREAPKALLTTIVINAISNLIFAPIQFGLQNNLLALIDILIVLVSLIFFVKISYKVDKRLAFSQIPYLLWVSFATILQFSITWLNW